MTSSRKDWVADLIAEVPTATADYDHLVSVVLPRMTTRAVKALLDALKQARREGR